MPLDVYLEAQYADGFILREDEQDHSPYNTGRNIFHAILNRKPELAHGAMVRYSLVTPAQTHSVDWANLPDNARPIRFKHIERCSMGGQWVEEPRTVRIDFGYQYTDAEGANVQEVIQIT